MRTVPHLRRDRRATPRRLGFEPLDARLPLAIDLSAFASQQVELNASVGQLNFTVSDSATPAAQLLVTATSSNGALVPNERLTITGAGQNRQLSLVPESGVLGTSTITVSAVGSEGVVVNRSFQVTVSAVNTAPTFAPSADVFLEENHAPAGVNAIPLFLTDDTTAVDQLQVSVVGSSNPTALPIGNQSVFYDAAAKLWRLQIVPAQDQFTPSQQTAPDQLTIQVSDGRATTTFPVNVRVAHINRLPHVSLDSVRAIAATPGAVVGNLTVTDPDPGDTVTVLLSDTSNFQVDGNVLKVSDSASLVAGVPYDLTITVVDNSGAATNSSSVYYQITAAATPPLVKVELAAVNGSGAELDSVSPGEVFFVVGTITDLRVGAGAEGVRDAYMTIRGDSNSPITSYAPGPLFANGNQSTVSPTFGLFVGGTTAAQTPAVGTQELFRFQVTAPAAGSSSRVVFSQISFDPSPYPIVLVDSTNGPRTLTSADIEFHALSLDVVAPGSQIAVSGGGNIIASALVNTPNATDGTDFGSVDVTSGAVNATFTINNPSASNLQILGTPFVAITGVHAADFTVSTQPFRTTAGGGSSDFTITFDPQSVGTRRAVVTIYSDAPGSSPYQFVVQGAGTQANIGPINLTLSNTTVRGAAAGALVGTVTVTDSNLAEQFTFVVSDPRFEVVNGQLKLREGISLDASVTTLPVTITAADRGGLTVARDFTLSVIAPEKLLRVSLQAFRPNGVTPLTQLSPFQDFLVRAVVEDLRATPTGVQSAYVDLSYSAALATLANGGVTFGASFPNLHVAGGTLAGLLDDAGGSAATAIGNGAFELFSAKFRAGSTGQLTFTPSLGESHWTTLTGLSMPLDSARVEVVPLTLSITGSQFPWHNPNLAADVDNSGVVDVQDIAWVVYYFGNIDLSNSAPDPQQPIYLDVFADGQLDAQDILQTLYDYVQATGGEGETPSTVEEFDAAAPADDVLALLANDLAVTHRRKQLAV